jgi:arabinofuranan 3-O-arabinosyltransferase
MSFIASVRGTDAPPPLTGDQLEDAPSDDLVSRWVLGAVGAGFLVLCLLQEWGLIEDDTKLSLILAPGAYLRASLHLWSDHLFAGAVTQSVSLYFPMGPVFEVARLLGVPTWVTERIWLAVLLTVGFWGVVRLAEALRIGKPYARVLAGVAYCITPIVLSWTTTTAALLAVVLLPWVVRPLVVGSREGSTRRAAAHSGLALALMGGANATVVLAVLPLAVIWLLTRTPGRRRRSLIGWWVVAVGCACFWWAFSLLLAGKYGYNYLPYTETAADTTATTSAFEALRGASYWTDYDSLGGTLLPGVWTVVSSTAVIVGTSTLTALGLVGLCRRTPERRVLVASMAVGVVAIAAGYAGASGAPFAHGVQLLLDTTLTPFRNVSKFAPDVALPLALGLASTLSLAPRRRARRAKSSRGATILAFGVAGVTVAALVVAATPFWRLQLYGTGGFQAIPSYWNQAGKWLDTHQGHHNALLVPGANSAQYTWGDPIDEPLEAVSTSPLVWSDVIPLGSNGSTQTLSAVERVLDSGTSAPGFAQFLARQGIAYVIERNDLNLTATGAPPPAQVHQVLSETAGLTEVAAFGPVLPRHQVQVGTLPLYNSPADTHLRPVEIYRVAGSLPTVRTYPVSNPVIVSGDAGSLLPLESTGILESRASVLAGDSLTGAAAQATKATWAITDGNQRRDIGFGAVRNNASYLLGPDQILNSKPLSIPLTYTVVPGARHQTVEAPIGGVASVAASSYGSSNLYVLPTAGPASAFDGNPGTAWVANATNDSVGQWLSATFTRPITLSTITVTPLAGSPLQPTIARITIATDRGSVERSLTPRDAPVRLTVPRGATRFIKFTIDAVRPAQQESTDGIAVGAGITDVRIPGASFQQNMKIPSDETANFSAPSRNPPVVALSRPLPNANLFLGSSATDDPEMSRTFTLPKSIATDVTGYAVPVPSASLESLINFFRSPTLLNPQVTASSWLGGLPRFRPENLLGTPRSPWIAGLGDGHPVLTLTWNGSQTVDSADLTLTPNASRPTVVSVAGAIGPAQRVRVPTKGGLIHFAPIVGNALRITFLQSAPKETISPTYDSPVTLPVGLASLRVPNLDLADVPAPDMSFPLVLTCGQGPPLTVDGTSIATSVTATLGDLIDLKPVRITACAPNSLPLAAGMHHVQARSAFGPFEVTSLTLENPLSAFASTHPQAKRTASVLSWNAASRTVGMGAGNATYLVIPQNYNQGWVATLNGRILDSVRIDGWQQGYIVPAGAAGTVQLAMTSDGIFRLGLLLGALLLVVLLLLAFLPSKRPTLEPLSARRPPPFWVLSVASVLLLFLVGGPLALTALPLLVAARKWGGRPMAAVAFIAFMVAGVAVAWNAGAQPSTHSGAFGHLAQIASIVAFGAVLSATAAERRSGRSLAGSGLERHPAPLDDSDNPGPTTGSIGLVAADTGTTMRVTDVGQEE